METNNTSPVTIETPAFQSFLAGAQAITVAHINALYANNARLFTTELVPEAGPRYIRIVKQETVIATGEVNNRSAHCFIDRTTGDVLKSSSWKTPAKGARGNIFDAQNGLGRMGPYGTQYNR